MVYGTYSRGYKPRAFNTAATLTSNDTLTPVDKESINHFELGSKSSLMQGALSFSAALFNTTYQNFQVQLYPPGQVIPSLELKNAAKARTRGLEAEGAFYAADTPAPACRSAPRTSTPSSCHFADGPAYPGQTPAQGAVLAGFDGNGAPVWKQDLSGKTMPDSPKFKATLGLDQAIGGDSLPMPPELQRAVRLPHAGPAAGQPEPGNAAARLRHPEPGPDGDFPVGSVQRHGLRQQRHQQVLPGER